MFLTELYKALRKKEILLLIIAGIAVDIFFASMNDVILPEGLNRKVYQDYIRQVEGKYTDEKKDFLVDERDRLQNYLDQWTEYEEKYRNGEIESDEYSTFMTHYTEANRKIDTLEYLVEKSLYYEELSRRSENVMYFDEIEADDYVGNMGIDLAVVLLLTVIIVNLFGEDFACGTHYMVITSEKGRAKLYGIRLRCMVMISFLIGLSFPCLEWGTKAFCYDLGNMDADIRCLNTMRESGLDMKIREYLLLCVAVRTVAAICYSALVMAISLLVQNMISDYVIAVGFLFLPYIMYDQLARVLKVFSLCCGFSVYQGFGSGMKLFGIHGMVIWTIFYGMLSVILAVAMLGRQKEKVWF